ncbi:MAG: FtsB family cell division protein [Bacillota bacterium]
MAAKRTKKLNKRRLLKIACVALLVYIGVLLLQQEGMLHALDQEKQQIQKEIETVKAEGKEYQNAIDYADSESFVEKEARDKLGMIKDGELQFIVKPKE